MSFFGNFSKLFRSRDRPNDHQLIDNQSRNLGSGIRSGMSFLFGSKAAGKVVNERTAMQTTAVYACVRILAESIASLPFHIYKRRIDGGKEKATNHYLYNTLHDEPNSEMTSFVFRETLMAHLLLYGNAYAQIIRTGWGRVVALYPLLPSHVSVEREQTGRYAGQIIYTYHSEDGEVRLQRDNVLHIPGLGFDGLIGYSPIAMAKNAVGIAIATEEYGSKFFANGANPGGVLEHPGKVGNLERLKADWNEAYRGSGNSHRVAILEEGLKFHQMSIRPEQAQFLQTRKYQLNEIARVFRIPPHMIGDLEKSSFSNIEQQSLEFVKYTLDPWIIRWEQTLKQSLLLPSEKDNYDIKFNLDGLLRGDYASRMTGYSTGRQNGWLSVNDIRELENMNRIPVEEGGDLYHMNGNMVRLNAEKEETKETKEMEVNYGSG